MNFEKRLGERVPDDKAGVGDGRCLLGLRAASNSDSSRRGKLCDDQEPVRITDRNHDPCGIGLFIDWSMTINDGRFLRSRLVIAGNIQMGVIQTGIDGHLGRDIPDSSRG